FVVGVPCSGGFDGTPTVGRVDVRTDLGEFFHGDVFGLDVLLLEVDRGTTHLPAGQLPKTQPDEGGYDHQHQRVEGQHARGEQDFEHVFEAMRRSRADCTAPARTSGRGTVRFHELVPRPGKHLRWGSGEVSVVIRRLRPCAYGRSRARCHRLRPRPGRRRPVHCVRHRSRATHRRRWRRACHRPRRPCRCPLRRPCRRRCRCPPCSRPRPCRRCPRRPPGPRPCRRCPRHPPGPRPCRPHCCLRRWFPCSPPR